MIPMILYHEIIDAIIQAAGICKTEPKIVETAVNEISGFKFSGNIKVNAGFCHMKPYALFISPDNMFNKIKTELGDFLFIIKYKENGVIIDNRALFFQAKLNKKAYNFKIEKHQHQFYSQISDVIFKFGNLVYKAGNTSEIIWSKISTQNNFGNYLLINPNKTFDFFTNIISTQYSYGQKSFTFKLNPPIKPMDLRRLMSYSALVNFLIPFGIGMQVRGDLQMFFDLIYKKLDMVPDPPIENEGYWFEGENPNGFGLIEFTVGDTQ